MKSGKKNQTKKKRCYMVEMILNIAVKYIQYIRKYRNHFVISTVFKRLKSIGSSEYMSLKDSNTLSNDRKSFIVKENNQKLK